jgi:hypothetical protein
VLGHPNTRLFVSHCGWHSVNEAAYHGVPVVAIPFQFEQVRARLVCVWRLCRRRWRPGACVRACVRTSVVRPRLRCCPGPAGGAKAWQPHQLPPLEQPRAHAHPWQAENARRLQHRGLAEVMPRAHALRAASNTGGGNESFVAVEVAARVRKVRALCCAAQRAVCVWGGQLAAPTWRMTGPCVRLLRSDVC